MKFLASSISLSSFPVRNGKKYACKIIIVFIMVLFISSSLGQTLNRFVKFKSVVSKFLTHKATARLNLISSPLYDVNSNSVPPIPSSDIRNVHSGKTTSA